MYTTKGKVTFDPVAGKAKNQWWYILECPKDIIEYYGHWVMKETGLFINKPLFGSHISIIRGEEPHEECKHLWRYNHNEEIEFQFSPYAENAGDYWWLPVKSDDLAQIRINLGLSPYPEHGFHLTLGKLVQK